MADRSQGHDGGGGRASFGAQSRQPGEVAAQPTGVRDSTRQAEPERHRYPPASDRAPLTCARAERPIRVDLHRSRYSIPAVVAKPTLGIEPVLRQTVVDLIGVIGPRVSVAEVEEPGTGLVIQGVTEVSRDETTLTAGLDGETRRLPVHHVVVLPARPAEREWQEAFAAVARHEKLARQSEVPVGGRFGRCIHGVASADELVKSEGEGGGARPRIPDFVSCEQVGAEATFACLLADTGERSELGGGPLRTVDRRGYRPYQATLLEADPERGLDPTRHRIGGQIVERVRRSSRRHRSGEGLSVTRLGRSTVRGDPFQRLADNVLGAHIGAEQSRADSRQMLLTLLVGSLRGQGGGSPDTPEGLRARRLAQPPNQQRHIGALPPPVAMQLVENQEAQRTESPHELPIPVTREDQLQHHVVGEQDVGRIALDPVPRLEVILSRVALEGHRSIKPRPEVEELGEFLHLAVGQGVHRVHDDRLDARARTRAEHMIDDRDDVGQALAGAGSGGQHVVAVVRCNPDGLRLVAPKGQAFAHRIGLRLAKPEDRPGRRMQHPFLNQLLDGSSRRERGIQTDPRMRPQLARVESLLNTGPDSLVADPHEARGVLAVGVDEALAQLEDVHQKSPGWSGWFCCQNGCCAFSGCCCSKWSTT